MVTGFYNTTNALYVSLLDGNNQLNSSRNSTDGVTNWNAVLPYYQATDFVNYSVDGRVYADYYTYGGGKATTQLLSSTDLSNWSVNDTINDYVQGWVISPLTFVEFNKHFYITAQILNDTTGALMYGSIFEST